MLIRRAEQKDADRIAFLGKEMVDGTPFNAPISKEKVSKFISLSHVAAFVAEKNEEVVGLFFGVVDKQFFTNQLRAVDLALFVTEKHRGSSAAFKLVKSFESWAKEKGATQVWLGQSVGKDIEKTKQFYERLGYKVQGVNTMKEII